VILKRGPREKFLWHDDFVDNYRNQSTLIESMWRTVCTGSLRTCICGQRVHVARGSSRASATLLTSFISSFRGWRQGFVIASHVTKRVNRLRSSWQTWTNSLSVEATKVSKASSIPGRNRLRLAPNLPSFCRMPAAIGSIRRRMYLKRLPTCADDHNALTPVLRVLRVLHAIVHMCPEPSSSFEKGPVA
jgi:hypothetical protein